MWKSKATLERQLESERDLNKKLTEQLKTVTDMLEHQVRENDDQLSLLMDYHRVTRRMITNQVMGWEESLKNLQHILQGCTPLELDCYSTGDNISMLLHVIRKELEKTSDTAYFSKELLQVLANNYRGV